MWPLWADVMDGPRANDALRACVREGERDGGGRGQPAIAFAIFRASRASSRNMPLIGFVYPVK